jgi:hypothetical protein
MEGSMTSNAGGDIFLHSTKVMLEHERTAQEAFQDIHQIIDVVLRRFPAPMCKILAALS